jgi:hypothetical protein
MNYILHIFDRGRHVQMFFQGTLQELEKHTQEFVKHNEEQGSHIEVIYETILQEKKS